MLDDMSFIDNGDERFMCSRNTHMHDESLDGVPVGAILKAQVEGLPGFFGSPFKKDVQVSVHTQAVTGNDRPQHRAVPKRVFLHLPPNHRYSDFASITEEMRKKKFDSESVLSLERADQINHAVHLALDPNAKNVPNPFRLGDSQSIAETMAILSDFRHSNLRTANGWRSHSQIRESGMAIHEDRVHLNGNKLASLDAEWYRNLISGAVARLLSNKVNPKSGWFPVKDENGAVVQEEVDYY